MKMNATTTIVAVVGACALVGYQLWQSPKPVKSDVEMVSQSSTPTGTSGGHSTASPTSSSQAPHAAAGQFRSAPGASAASISRRPHDEMPIPDPIPRQLGSNTSAPVQLWELDPVNNNRIEVDGISATPLHVETTKLDGITVGQTLELPIPALNKVLSAEIESTHNQLGQVKVWKGPISGGDITDNLIITQGEINTVVVVSTIQGTYTVTIDNTTGQATLVDEADVNAGIIPHDDSRTVPPIELTPPNATAS
ncbi:hypothetical protein BTA51_13710 [Hahella sp. CCB-MM4]|uniref:hypothetical protein n=1 Tax=Hahella sp. (strain CCB-MM4) TaxID=1926491 RepID=UPI000B9BD88D|nr:hypothetical protein [Hahella sp. CCB-MM4]OZG73006.1 hypothetical protein BTA51_13710 [Hahella sp. CCB-MM4]